MTGKATVPAYRRGRDFGVVQGAKNAHSRVPIAIGISLFATQKYLKRYLGLPVGLGLT